MYTNTENIQNIQDCVSFLLVDIVDIIFTFFFISELGILSFQIYLVIFLYNFSIFSIKYLEVLFKKSVIQFKSTWN